MQTRQQRIYKITRLSIQSLFMFWFKNDSLPSDLSKLEDELKVCLFVFCRILFIHFEGFEFKKMTWNTLFKNASNFWIVYIVVSTNEVISPDFSSVKSRKSSSEMHYFFTFFSFFQLLLQVKKQTNIYLFCFRSCHFWALGSFETRTQSSVACVCLISCVFRGQTIKHSVWCP